MDGSSPRRTCDPASPHGRVHARDDPWLRFEASHALDLNWGEWFEREGLGGRGGHGRMRELVRERVRFKWRGAPQPGSVQLDRSDRSPLPVRPVRPRLKGGVLVLCFAVWVETNDLNYLNYRGLTPGCYIICIRYLDQPSWIVMHKTICSINGQMDRALRMAYSYTY